MMAVFPGDSQLTSTRRNRLEFERPFTTETLHKGTYLLLSSFCERSPLSKEEASEHAVSQKTGLSLGPIQRPQMLLVFTHCQDHD